ncbi:hypothetical protein K438DRAFT_1947741 [Mycena galopus ATCC 62051]|nr:hypothetical protein K438DRAFT_1947741 [Mycena galopus ATCC 62051]
MTCDGEDSETTAIALCRYWRGRRKIWTLRAPGKTGAEGTHDLRGCRSAQRDERLIPCVEKGRRDETRMHFACEPGQMAPEGRVEGCDPCGVETQNIDVGNQLPSRGCWQTSCNIGWGLVKNRKRGLTSATQKSLHRRSEYGPAQAATSLHDSFKAYPRIHKPVQPIRAFRGSSTGMRVLLLEGRGLESIGSRRPVSPNFNIGNNRLTQGTVSSDEGMVEEGRQPKASTTLSKSNSSSHKTFILLNNASRILDDQPPKSGAAVKVSRTLAVKCRNLSK